MNDAGNRRLRSWQRLTDSQTPTIQEKPPSVRPIRTVRFLLIGVALARPGLLYACVAGSLAVLVSVEGSADGVINRPA